MNVILLFIISGGVGFDINCGVRLLRTNLNIKDIQPVKEQLAQVSLDDVVLYNCDYDYHCNHDYDFDHDHDYDHDYVGC